METRAPSLCSLRQTLMLCYWAYYCSLPEGYPLQMDNWEFWRICLIFPQAWLRWIVRLYYLLFPLTVRRPVDLWVRVRLWVSKRWTFWKCVRTSLGVVDVYFYRYYHLLHCEHTVSSTPTGGPLDERFSPVISMCWQDEYPRPRTCSYLLVRSLLLSMQCRWLWVP